MTKKQTKLEGVTPGLMLYGDGLSYHCHQLSSPSRDQKFSSGLKEIKEKSKSGRVTEEGQESRDSRSCALVVMGASGWQGQQCFKIVRNRDV